MMTYCLNIFLWYRSELRNERNGTYHHKGLSPVFHSE